MLKCSRLPSLYQVHHSIHYVNKMAVCDPSEAERLTASCEKPADGFETWCRKDSGMGVAAGTDQQMTSPNDFCSPEGDLGTSSTNNWMLLNSQQSTPPTSEKITDENLPPPDWMDQIDASDELKEKREEANKTRFLKTTFLHIPERIERCRIYFPVVFSFS